MTRWKRAASVASVGAVSALMLLAEPDACGACPPSGLPGETLYLTLESVKVDGLAADTLPYGVSRMTVAGVGPSFTLTVELGDTTLFGTFVK